MRAIPVISAFLIATLAACGSAPTPSANTTTGPASLLTVKVTPDVSDQVLAQRYGGTVALRTDTFALISDPQRRPLGALDTSAAPAEENQDVFSTDPDAASSWANGVAYTWADGVAYTWADGVAYTWADGVAYTWADGVAYTWADGVAYTWADGKYNLLPGNTGSWKQIGLDTAQKVATRLGKDTVVAVIDSGLDLKHRMFYNRLSAPDTWMDFADHDSLPQDEGQPGQGAFGHGTEVAGITLQIAPRTKVMPLRVLDSDGRGDVLSVATAVVWAVNHGANVINLSLGAAKSSPALNAAIAYANSKNVAVAAAAGNSNRSVLDYPAADFKADGLNVSVGSVSSSDLKSDFSSYNQTLSVTAPGESIVGPFPGDRAAAWSGTSMSSPVVAGALALAISEGRNAQQAVSTLKSSATNVDDLNSAYAGKIGSGRINLAKFFGQ